jgi:nicotinate-nucleotide adenylyltransferase
MRIGLLGGSFDPVHFGHLHVAITLLEAHDLDEVLFCPASKSPFKTDQPPIAAKHRRALVELAIKEIDSFSVLDWEIEQSGPSYMIDTVKRWKKQNKAELFLLMGEDQLPHLHRWKSVDELFTLCRPLIASRENHTASVKELSAWIQKLVAEGRTKSRVLEISSTEVRRRLKEGLYCGHLLPHLVLDYIQEHRLYS